MTKEKKKKPRGRFKTGVFYDSESGLHEVTGTYDLPEGVEPTKENLLKASLEAAVEAAINNPARPTRGGGGKSFGFSHIPDNNWPFPKKSKGGKGKKPRKP